MYKRLFFSLLLFSSIQMHPNEVVQRALRLELPACSTTNSIEVTRKFRERAGKKIKIKADYQAALEIIMKALKKHPEDFYAQADFAAILGDLSELFSGEIQNQMIERSKQLFEKLMQEVDNKPMSDEIFGFKNEYYFRLSQHQKQYENGVDLVNYYWQTEEWMAHGVSGYYCQGVGAAHTAKQLMIKGEIQQAKVWAQKSVVAWAQYFSYKNNYYNSYVHYALALGILGYTDEMMKALSHSADLIKKDLDYVEFKDVTDFIESMK